MAGRHVRPGVSERLFLCVLVASICAMRHAIATAFRRATSVSEWLGSLMPAYYLTSTVALLRNTRLRRIDAIPQRMSVHPSSNTRAVGRRTPRSCTAVRRRVGACDAIFRLVFVAPDMFRDARVLSLFRTKSVKGPSPVLAFSSQTGHGRATDAPDWTHRCRSECSPTLRLYCIVTVLSRAAASPPAGEWIAAQSGCFSLLACCRQSHLMQRDS